MELTQSIARSIYEAGGGAGRGVWLARLQTVLIAGEMGRELRDSFKGNHRFDGL